MHTKNSAWHLVKILETFITSRQQLTILPETDPASRLGFSLSEADLKVTKKIYKKYNYVKHRDIFSEPL